MAAARKRAAPKDGATPARARKAAAPRAESSAPARAPPAVVERVVFPRALYDERKDEIKAPLKERGLKWQFLGEGRGRYHAEGVAVFVQQSPEGADFTLRASDEAAGRAIVDAWRRIAGAAAFAAAKEQAREVVQEEKAAARSEATRLWELARPLRRPGEPEGFYRRRLAEWEAQRPAE